MHVVHTEALEQVAQFDEQVVVHDPEARRNPDAQVVHATGLVQALQLVPHLTQLPL